MGSSLPVTVAGAAVRIAVALGVSRFLRALLFGVSASDPWTYAGVVALIVGVGALASWPPALRATRIDPVTALRVEELD